jgi:hypothetical protein
VTILFVGSTPVDFGCPATSLSTSATGRDAAYSPSSVLTLGQSAFMNIPVDAGTDFWFHFRVHWNNVGSGNASSSGIGFRIIDGTGNVICDHEKSSSASYNHVLRVFGTTTVTNATGLLFVSNTTYTIDVKLTVGANITAELYVNGALHSTSTVANGGTVKGKPRRMLLDYSYRLNSGSTGINYTEGIVAVDESTLGARLATLEPASAGAFSAWTGDVAALADADSGSGVFATAAAQRFNSVFGAYGGAASPASVRGLFLKAHATQAGAVSPTQLNQSIRIGGTNYDGAAQAIVPGVANLHEWANDPATSAPWLTSAWAALEGGLLAA